MSTQKKAIIYGATGAVGKPLLAELLKSPEYSQVHAFVRKHFKESSPHKDDAKLVEHVIDFDKLVDSKEHSEEIRDVDANTVYITLGTTRATAGSAGAFERIDREYVVAGAQAALQNAADARAKQSLVYLSSTGATSGSPFLYPKSKGLTEEALSALGYPDCILFRPGFLAEAQREKSRALESIFGSLMTNVAARFTDSAEIKVSLLAKAMAFAGLQGSAGLTSAGVGSPPSDKFKRDGQSNTKITVVNNAEAKRLATIAQE